LARTNSFASTSIAASRRHEFGIVRKERVRGMTEWRREDLADDYWGGTSHPADMTAGGSGRVLIARNHYAIRLLGGLCRTNIVSVNFAFFRLVEILTVD
jgi:hypothetical protein